jgi:hypothetical protein
VILAQTITDVVLEGLKYFGIASGLAIAALFVCGWLRAHNLRKLERQQEARDRRVDALLEDFAQREMASSIRVIGGSRRGPERVAGPGSRTDRLPFEGRRR